MKTLAAMLCLLLAAMPPALAQDSGKTAAKKEAAAAGKTQAKAKMEPTERQLAHQKKMKECSQQAAEKKLRGEERKQFMTGCLKA